MAALTVLALGGVSAQAPPSRQTTDTAAVLKLISGSVELYGTTFGSVAFQQGLLRQLETKAITSLRVMTRPESAQNMMPLVRYGASVYTVPAVFKQSMIIGISAQGGVVVFPQVDGSYRVIQGSQQAASISGLMKQYWQWARKVR